MEFGGGSREEEAGNGVIQCIHLFDWHMDIKAPDFLEFFLGEVAYIVLVDVLTGGISAIGDDS